MAAKRYNLDGKTDGDGNHLPTEDEEGILVLHTDYAALGAENKRLRIAARALADNAEELAEAWNEDAAPTHASKETVDYYAVFVCQNVAEVYAALAPTEKAP